MMSVCVPQSHSSSPGPDVANRSSPLPTPPTSLSLRSSHNQLLNCDVIKPGSAELRGSATPPKCRKKYALTNIQSAMGLGEPLLPAAAPSSSTSSTSSNPKLAKNGANQLRKAAEQNDLNKNVTVVDPIPGGEDESDGCNNVPEKPEGWETKAPPPRSKSPLDYYDSDPPDPPKEDDPTLPLLSGEETLPLPPTPPKQPSPGYAPPLSAVSSSSSPETKKDRPRNGAKTDCALNRIQSLAPSDEDSSWTTLSQDSASPVSPEEAGNKPAFCTSCCVG